MSDAQPTPEVDLDTFAGAYASGAAVLDVRRPDEYVERHVPGAVLIPLDELAGRLDDVPGGDPLYVICKSGGRSLTAAAVLRAAGRDAVSVAGGTDGWASSGRPVLSGDDPGDRPRA